MLLLQIPAHQLSSELDDVGALLLWQRCNILWRQCQHLSN